MPTDWIREILLEVRGDVKEIRRSVAALEVDSTAQNASLDEHMRRTAAAEEQIALLKNELKPLKTRAAVESALLRGISILAALIGAAVGVAKLMGHG